MTQKKLSHFYILNSEKTSAKSLLFSAGKWGAWGNYSVCSVTCGNGTQIRSRLCNNPPPQFGGADCVGNSTSSLVCVRTKCAPVGTYIVFFGPSTRFDIYQWKKV